MIGTLIAKKAVYDAFDAMNRKDIEKFMSAWAKDGEFVYPGDIGVSGFFQGRENVRGWIKGFFQQFPGLTFTVTDICARNNFDLIGNNVVAAHWDLKLKNRDGHEGVNSGVTVIKIKSGKVVKAIDYLFDTGEAFKKNWGAI